MTTLTKLKIRRLIDSDLSQLSEMFENVELIANTSQLPYFTEAQWRENMVASEQRINLVAELDGRAIGHICLMPDQKQRQKHCVELAITIHPEFHGQGVGSQLMAEAVDMADNWLNCIRLYLTVFSENTAAIALYKKFDFVIEGEHKYASFSQGRYQSLLTMARYRFPG